MYRKKVGWEGTHEWVAYLPPALAQAWPKVAYVTTSLASRLQSHCKKEVPAATVWTSSPYLHSCSRMTVGFCISPSVPFCPQPHTPYCLPKPCVAISNMAFPHHCGNVPISQSLRNSEGVKWVGGTKFSGLLNIKPDLSGNMSIKPSYTLFSYLHFGDLG